MCFGVRGSWDHGYLGYSLGIGSAWYNLADRSAEGYSGVSNFV